MTWQRSNRGYAKGRRLPAELHARVLAEEPVCRLCGTRASRHVDHVVSVSRRPDLFGVRSNLQGVCPPCHRSKTARVDSKPLESRKRAPEAHPGDLGGTPGGGENLESTRMTAGAALPVRGRSRVSGVSRYG